MRQQVALTKKKVSRARRVGGHQRTASLAAGKSPGEEKGSSESFLIMQTVG
jgi:hypothetical protein